MDAVTPKTEYRGAHLRKAITKHFDWTDEALRQLKDWFKAGDSATTIALKLDPSGGLTRSAVAGKLARLRIFRTGQRQPEELRRQTEAGRLTMKISRKLTPERALELQPQQIKDLPPENPTNNSVRLVDLELHHCRWPIGDPGSPDFVFCGNPNHEGPYCVGHARIAYAGKERRHAA